MAFKVTKDEQAEINAAVDAAIKAKEEFEAEVERINTTLAELQEGLAAKVAAYNDAAESVSMVAQDLVSRLREEFDERSEKWMESERAETVSGWIDDLENLAWNDTLDCEIPEINVEEPEWVHEKFNDNFRAQPEE